MLYNQFSNTNQQSSVTKGAIIRNVIMGWFNFFSFIKFALFFAVVKGTSPPFLCYQPEDFKPEVCPNYAVETHYREIGCKPIFAKPGDCCPERYDCSELENFKPEATTKCHYGGRSYAMHERIEDSDKKDECSASCVCQEGYPAGSPAHFTCAQIECPSLFGVYPMPPCYNKYKAGKCCPTEYCPPTSKDAIEATPPAPGCTFDGKTYRDGDKIYPTGNVLTYKCKSCLCTAGKVECNTYRCGIELRHFADIVVGGAVPQYLNYDQCCPIGYIYPADTDTVVKQNEGTAEIPPEKKCKFGNLELQIGDELSQKEDTCTKCSCITPPLITCVKGTEC